ncbi:MAG: NADPH-dependent F420 reductase [Rhodovibrionaceae bacterium]
MNNSLANLSIVGGTGALGSAVAWRAARAGYNVTIGSRNQDKAQVAAQQIKSRLPATASIAGLDNAAAAQAAEIVFLTVPYASHEQTLADIRDGVAGKILVDATVPLVPPRVASYQAPASGTAALRAKALLDDSTQVVSALHNVAAHKLAEDIDVDCDVLVCGDSLDARQAVIDILAAIGLRGLHAGGLANSAAAEALTSILIGINKRYKVDGAGIRITGNLIPPEPQRGT